MPCCGCCILKSVSCARVFVFSFRIDKSLFRIGRMTAHLPCYSRWCPIVLLTVRSMKLADATFAPLHHQRLMLPVCHSLLHPFIASCLLLLVITAPFPKQSLHLRGGTTAVFLIASSVTPCPSCSGYLYFYTRAHARLPSFPIRLSPLSDIPLLWHLLTPYSAALGCMETPFFPCFVYLSAYFPNEEVSFSAANLMRAVMRPIPPCYFLHKITTRFPDLQHK